MASKPRHATCRHQPPSMIQSHPRLRWIGPLAIAALGLVSAMSRFTAPPPAAAHPATQSAARNPRLGLVHVDVMDLHVVRLPDAPPEDRAVLPAADIADRYRRAAESGAGWHRWSAYWDLVERAGTDTWTVTDGMVARDAAHGLSTLMVLQGNQPGVRYQAGAPEGLDQPAFLDAAGAGTDDPAQAARTNPANRWARFVGAVVDRYRPGGAFAQAQGAGSNAASATGRSATSPTCPASGAARRPSTPACWRWPRWWPSGWTPARSSSTPASPTTATPTNGTPASPTPWPPAPPPRRCRPATTTTSTRPPGIGTARRPSWPPAPIGRGPSWPSGACR